MLLPGSMPAGLLRLGGWYARWDMGFRSRGWGKGNDDMGAGRGLEVVLESEIKMTNLAAELE